MSMPVSELERDLGESSSTAFRAIVDLRHGVAAAFEVGAAEGIAELRAVGRGRHMLFVPEHLVVEPGVVVIARDESGVRHWASRGFEIALDHDAAGGASLPALLACSYVKFRCDGERVRQVAALARNIGAVPIASGVATWDEVETLIRCGVEWAEGPLFGAVRPAVSRRLVRTWLSLAG